VGVCFVVEGGVCTNNANPREMSSISVYQVIYVLGLFYNSNVGYN